MKQLNLEELEIIKQVHTDVQNQVLNPNQLNEAYKLISDEVETYLHSKRAKLLAIKRFMIFQYDNQLQTAMGKDVLDTLFDEKTYEEDIVDAVSNEYDETITNTPDDEVTVSPTKIVNKQKSKGMGRAKQTHKE